MANQDSQPTVVSLLLEDHDHARRLLTKVATTKGEEQRDAFRELVVELVRHETAEQEILYPQVRTELIGGNELADARRHEEEESTRLLAQLEKLETGSAAFDKLFAQLREAVLSHATAEETDVFPRLAVMKDEIRLKAMARLLEAVKKTAPTHPHPHVPGTSAVQLVVAPMAAVLDRTRDAIADVLQRANH